MPEQTRAASFAVNLNTDAHDANAGNGVCDSNSGLAGEQCTLRAAIEETNALAGIDFISFSLPLPSTIDLTLGELSVVGSVGINGPGARALSVERLAGAPDFRIFIVEAVNTSVSISGMSIVNGSIPEGSSGGGAGIRNVSGSSSLNLTGVTVRNNISKVAGGGIQNNGTLNITRSTISNNTGGQGGGINNGTNGVMNISNSTVSGNQALNVNALGLGGGIINLNALTLNNVTVSNNNATNSGGGIQLFGASQTLNIRNTIVAGNTATNSDDEDFNSDGVAISLGNNLIGISAGGNGFTNGANGDKVGTLAAPLDAKLGALKDNGGQTDTHALLAGSPAIDAGNNCVVAAVCSVGTSQALTTDQRGAGYSRQLDGDGNGTATVDIGAFETITITTAAEAVAGGRVLTANGKGIRNVRVSIIFPNGETRSILSGEGGYYQFSDVPVGETYIFSVSAKHYTFAQGTQIRSIADDIEDIDFIANPSPKSVKLPQ